MPRNCAIPAVTALLCIPQLLSGCTLIVGASVGRSFESKFNRPIEDALALSAEDQAKLKQVKFATPADAVNGTRKGRVSGLSCKLTGAMFRSTWQPELNNITGNTPQEAARTELLIKAMRKGANAVADAKCVHHAVIDWRNNCFESWVCTGEAIIVP